MARMHAPRLLAWSTLVLVGAGALTLLATPSPAPRAAVPAKISRAVPPRAKPSATPAKPAPYVIRRVLDTGGPIRFGAWFWDEKDVPPGEMMITVDTVAEVISVFRGGYEIGTAAIIYGADHKPTPLGVFPITQKRAKHVSNLYGAPMPYMLRLTNDGVAIHGGPVAPENATHGCIGVPIAFAKKLFAAVKVGDRVVVTRGERLALGGAVTAR